jgi:hypothetical protein
LAPTYKTSQPKSKCPWNHRRIEDNGFRWSRWIKEPTLSIWSGVNENGNKDYPRH